MFPNILTEPPSKFKIGFPDGIAPGTVETKFKAQFGVWVVNYNYQGELPSLRLEPHPARIPRHGRRTDPKKITDTTLRDGAQDPGFAIFSNEAKLKYYDLLHELDNGTGVIESVGKNIAHFSVGDPVFGSAGLRLGAYGAYVALPASYTIVAKPNNMSFEEAAGVPLGGLNA